MTARDFGKTDPTFKQAVEKAQLALGPFAIGKVGTVEGRQMVVSTRRQASKYLRGHGLAFQHRND